MDKNREVTAVVKPPYLCCPVEAYDFDLNVLSKEPGRSSFTRLAWPCDLPEGMFDKLSGDGRVVILDVYQPFPGSLFKRVFVTFDENGKWVRAQPHEGVIGQGLNHEGLHDFYACLDGDFHRVMPRHKTFVTKQREAKIANQNQKGVRP